MCCEYGLARTAQGANRIAPSLVATAQSSDCTCEPIFVPLGLIVDDPIEINRRNWDERATIHARDTTGFYGLDRVRANEGGLHSIEAAELGDVSRKRVLHLQCHIGTDTLRLVRIY